MESNGMLTDYDLQRENIYLVSTEASYTNYLVTLKELKLPQFNIEEALKKEKEIDEEMVLLNERLNILKLKRKQIQSKRATNAAKLHQIRKLKDGVGFRRNTLMYQHSLLLDRVESVHTEIRDTSLKLQKYMQINVLNDAFFIWYHGPFGTVNNFRLGNLPNKAVEWTEINAALGQAVIAVATVIAKAQIDLKKYILIPMGSFPKIQKVDDRRVTHCLFIDGSFSFFPKRNFNLAMAGFLTCIFELGEYINEHDPTLSLPYEISLADNTLQGQSVLLGSDDEMWTKALKFLLADVKWIVAWSTKHCSHPSY